MARLTVAMDTPAILATSSIVAGLDGELLNYRNTFSSTGSSNIYQNQSSHVGMTHFHSHEKVYINLNVKVYIIHEKVYITNIGATNDASIWEE